jgi:hypothetical protein
MPKRETGTFTANKAIPSTRRADPVTSVRDERRLSLAIGQSVVPFLQRVYEFLVENFLSQFNLVQCFPESFVFLKPILIPSKPDRLLLCFLHHRSRSPRYWPAAKDDFQALPRPRDKASVPVRSTVCQ